MCANPNQPGFDTSPAAAAERRFRFTRIIRKCKEEGRQLNAKIQEEKKRLPDVINKLCPYPLNPHQDCFAMTLETDINRRSKNHGPEPIIITGKSKVPADDEPQCLAMKHQLFIKKGKAAEALSFYEASFGAQVLTNNEEPQTKTDEEVPLITAGVEVKIGSNIILLSDLKDESSSPSSFFTLLTDDVEFAVEKAVKAGAAVSRKLVQVYSNCQVWCSLVKVNDPYGNVWIIYNKLCPSCLQSLLLLA